MRRIYTEKINETESWTYIVDMEGIKEEINQLKMETDIYTILAYVYDLFQNYYIPENIEDELYGYIDPKDIYNDYSPAEIWGTIDIKNNPLEQYCN